MSLTKKENLSGLLAIFGWNESAACPKRNSTSFCFTLIVRMLNLGSKTFHLNELQSYKFLLRNSIFMSSLHLHAKSGIFQTRLGGGKKKTKQKTIKGDY